MELKDRVTPYPFYEPITPWITILIYLLTIFLLHAWMKNRKPFEMRTLLGLHNLVLCIFSFYMTVGLGFRLIQVVQKGGLFGVYCGTTEYDMDKLLYWCDLFYLSKYYELLDTVFVVLRKKQLTLLHVWHHSAVVVVCYIATMDRIVMGWITVMDNTTVHTFMYYYYAIQVSFISNVTTDLTFPFSPFNEEKFGGENTLLQYKSFNSLLIWLPQSSSSTSIG